MPGLYNITRPKLWIDNFDQRGSSELDIGWYTVRTPYKSRYSLRERPGYLRIYGNYMNLTEVASPAVYLRKQTDFNATWSTSLEYYPGEQDVGEAGAVLWLTEQYNQAIGVRSCDSDPANRCIVTTTNTGTNLTFVVRYHFWDMSSAWHLCHLITNSWTRKTSFKFLIMGLSSFTSKPRQINTRWVIPLETTALLLQHI